MRYLVTAAQGLSAANFAELLLEPGSSVVAIDKPFSTSRSEEQRPLPHFQFRPQWRWFHGRMICGPLIVVEAERDPTGGPGRLYLARQASSLRTLHPGGRPCFCLFGWCPRWPAIGMRTPVLSSDHAHRG